MTQDTTRGYQPETPPESAGNDDDDDDDGDPFIGYSGLFLSFLGIVIYGLVGMLWTTGSVFAFPLTVVSILIAFGWVGFNRYLDHRKSIEIAKESQSEDPIEILKRRRAHGEISQEEFEERIAELQAAEVED